MAKSPKKISMSKSPVKSTNTIPPSDDENIDKIRDILFGSQTRQIESKLAAMEDKIDKDVESLRSETRTTLDTLEQFVRKELHSLSEQLSDEKSERGDSEESLSNTIANAKKSLEKKLTQLGDKVVKDQRETQEQILKQSKNLLDEMHQKNDALQRRVDQSVDSLTHEKTDRLALANLLMEAAMRLKDEFHIPETD